MRGGTWILLPDGTRVEGCMVDGKLCRVTVDKDGQYVFTPHGADAETPKPSKG